MSCWILWGKHILARYSAIDSNGSKSSPNGYPVIHAMITMAGMTKSESCCPGVVRTDGTKNDYGSTIQKTITYNCRTDSNTATQRQLILDREVDSGHTICERMYHNRRLSQRNHIPAMARTVGNRIKPVHSLLMYLFTAIAFAVTTSQSAVMATNCEEVDQHAYRGMERALFLPQRRPRESTRS